MVAMTIEMGWPPAGYPFTIHDLDRMPNDARRYELLDGALIVSPRPIVWHQKVAFLLAMVLHEACPPALDVIPEPAVTLSDVTEFDPDIVVIHRRQLRDTRLIEPPLLVVEVRSPSTAVIDRNRKKSEYEKFGVPSYWIVDPDPDNPELIVFELGEGGYEEIAHVAGDSSFPALKPFQVEIVPARLVAGLFPR
jgi:Uma2 family endonuclease